MCYSSQRFPVPTQAVLNLSSQRSEVRDVNSTLHPSSCRPKNKVDPLAAELSGRDLSLASPQSPSCLEDEAVGKQGRGKPPSVPPEDSRMFS